MGIAHKEKKDYDKAISYYQKAIEIKSDKHEAFYNMGHAYNEKKDYDKAISYYQKAIKIKPDKHDAFYNMGIAYAEKKDFDNAISCYQKAINIKPDYLNAYSNYGFTLIVSGAINNAEPILKKAIQLGDFTHSYMNLGHVYFVQNKMVKAMECYLKSLSMFESKDDFWDGMIDDFQHLTQYGITPEAYEALLQAIAAHSSPQA